MKTDYLYIILDARGQGRQVVSGGTADADLAGLLAAGWRPVRETAIPGEGSVLLVLERAVEEGSFGFGFNPK